MRERLEQQQQQQQQHREEELAIQASLEDSPETQAAILASLQQESSQKLGAGTHRHPAGGSQKLEISDDQATRMQKMNDVDRAIIWASLQDHNRHPLEDARGPSEGELSSRFDRTDSSEAASSGTVYSVVQTRLC